eukprot:6370164-Pyramimonas_sp.AAC.1
MVARAVRGERLWTKGAYYGPSRTVGSDGAREEASDALSQTIGLQVASGEYFRLEAWSPLPKVKESLDAPSKNTIGHPGGVVAHAADDT